MNQKISVGVLVVLVASLGFWFYTRPERQEEVVIGDVETENVQQEVKNVSATLSGTYETYNVSKLVKTESGNVVLFFHASWCPECRRLDSDIKANLNKIPANLTILDVDYDNSSDLKKKYGVTYQHTMVQVDKDGALIKKWSGSPTLMSLVSEVQN